MTTSAEVQGLPDLPGRTGEAPPAPAGAPPARARWRGVPAAAVPWLFVAPAVLLFVVFKYIPMIKGVQLSLYDVRPYLGNLWVGFGNYREVLTQPQFRSALGHTLVLAVGGTAGAAIVGTALALLLEGSARSLWFVRTAVFLPAVTATAVVGEMWRMIYYPAPDGFLNHLLGFVGLGPVPFLDGTDTSIWSVMGVSVWTGAPYDMVIILAGLVQVDRGLYEAAALDGASVRHRLRYITLPALRPSITILVILAVVRGLRTFTEVYVLTGGGPAGSTDVWMTRVYDSGFVRNQMGTASAAATLLFLVTVVLTVVMRVYSRRSEEK